MSSLLIMSECPCKAGLLAYASRPPCSERYDTIQYDTQLNSTENYGRRCLTPLSPHRNYILS